MRRIAALILLAVLLPARAFSQGDPHDPNGPDPAKIKVRLGPVLLNPSISFANIGVDENVFNDATDPKRDFTMTISPRTEWWLRFMGTWFNGLVSDDLVWYQTYASERSGNDTLGLNWKLPLSRMTLALGTSRTATRDRPGYEIDQRAARTQKSYSGSLAFRFLANTSIDVTAKNDQTDFDENATFDSVYLRDLNRHVTSVAGTVNQKLTPLTTLTFGMTRQHDRFSSDSLRDSDATHTTLALKFDPLALVGGSIAVAYTEFSPLSARLPGFRGPTLAGDLSYSPLDTTKVTFKVQRSLEYSYLSVQPYYVQTGFDVQVVQQVASRVDVVVRRGIVHLDYRNQAGAGLAERSDRVSSYGVGVGYHVGQTLRVGFNADRSHRGSPIASRQYERPLYGASITYDF